MWNGRDLKATERNFAGLLRSLPIRVHFHARELVSRLADPAQQLALLKEAVHEVRPAPHPLPFEHAHQALLFGSAAEHLRGVIHRYPPTDALLFEHACFATPAACGGGEAVFHEGLEALVLRFLEEAELLLNTRPEHLDSRNEHLQFIEAANMHALQRGVARFAGLLVEEGHGRLAAFAALQSAMFGAVCALLVLEYFFVFRRIISNLTDETRRTLPPDVIEATSSIKAHLYRLISRRALPGSPLSPGI
eukprot:tig00000981_g5858.t1